MRPDSFKAIGLFVLGKMNEDTVVSQNNNIEELSSASNVRVEIERAVYSEESLAQRLKPCTQAKNDTNTFKAMIRTKLKNRKCSPKMTLFSLFPITRWLPKYSFRRDFVADFTGGLTVGIFHVPQGKHIILKKSLNFVWRLNDVLHQECFNEATEQDMF